LNSTVFGKKKELPDLTSNVSLGISTSSISPPYASVCPFLLSVCLAICLSLSPFRMSACLSLSPFPLSVCLLKTSLFFHPCLSVCLSFFIFNVSLPPLSRTFPHSFSISFCLSLDIKVRNLSMLR